MECGRILIQIVKQGIIMVKKFIGTVIAAVSAAMLPAAMYTAFSTAPMFPADLCGLFTGAEG